MEKSNIPTVRFFGEVLHWIATGLDDLWVFLSSVAQNPPTSKAMVVGFFLLLLIIGCILAISGLIDWLAHRKKDDSDVQKLATKQKFTAWNAGDMVVQITRDKAVDLNLIPKNYNKKYVENVFIEAMQMTEIEGKAVPKYKRLSKAVVKVVFRKRLNFTDHDIAFSPKVESKLILSEEEPEKKDGTKAKGPKVTIIKGNFYRLRQVPWFTFRGAAIRTVLNPDQATALTYRIFIWSFFVSWALTEIYYDRAGMDAQREKAAEQAAIHQTH